MAIGAQDYIDKLLVKKYAGKQVENHEGLMEKMVDPEKMMETMNDIAYVQRNMLALSNKLGNICAQINAKARYKAKGQRFIQDLNG